MKCQAQKDAELKEAYQQRRLTPELYRASATEKGSYPKDSALMYWDAMPDQQPIMPHFEAIPDRAAGSSYGSCGIRIDGSPEFIDAVLSRLKDLIEAESGTTRLELSRSKVKPTEINGQRKEFNKAASNAEVMYIRRHERGQDAKAAYAFCQGIKAAGAKQEALL